MNIPRPEHPKPQMMREEWLNLNGEWDFEIDNAQSGIDRELYRADKPLSGKILVPFCPESTLSGVHHTDFIYGLVYRRTFDLPESWAEGRTRLHFGAVDYECTVYINEKAVGTHAGGHVSFSFDISRYLVAGENRIAVFVRDDTRDDRVPSGKQSQRFASHGCYYTRTTGIWQTVWLEHMPDAHVKWVHYYTDAENAAVTLVGETCGAGTLRACATYKGRAVGQGEVASRGGRFTLTLPLSERHLWEIGHGRLYDLTLTYGEDRVQSYFGLRSVSLDKQRFLFNGRSVFLRLILDQGYYPDGILTAPSDAELEGDIRRSMACGFNGARLHQKIFEERYLYHCDRLGYLVWSEFPDWGLDGSQLDSLYRILPEWLEEAARDFNHPSIVTWCLRNESRRGQIPEPIHMLYRTMRAVDPTRPCIDSSGWIHVETDIYDIHNYEQDPAVLQKTLEGLYNPDVRGEKYLGYGGHDGPGFPQQYAYDRPFVLSEYGGISYRKGEGAWGYGRNAESEEEFYERFAGLTRVILENPAICGFCYTQLTDVEQEQNGLYTFGREPKFDAARLRAIVASPAAIEKE